MVESRNPILTLTTDFGASGPYVAAIKGVVLGLVPRVHLVDVSHAIAPQDIAGGAFLLAEVVPWFPEGTVHLAVVDPGVGTDRRLLAVEVEGRTFVLPDNGLIAEVLRGREPSGAWEIRNPGLRLRSVSDTFHGRDILAPAAAHLLNGGRPADLGPEVRDLLRPSSSPIVGEGDGLIGEVLFIDPFGNLVTNIGRDRLGSHSDPGWTIEILGRSIDGLIRTYADRPSETLVGLIGSSDRLEIAVVNGDAARTLDARRGTPVHLRPKPEPRP